MEDPGDAGLGYTKVRCLVGDIPKILGFLQHSVEVREENIGWKEPTLKTSYQVAKYIIICSTLRIKGSLNDGVR
jgi:hypothetical protein